eukprot:1138498-Pelagomonas_calceolata.AAC.1
MELCNLIFCLHATQAVPGAAHHTAACVAHWWWFKNKDTGLTICRDRGQHVKPFGDKCLLSCDCHQQEVVPGCAQAKSTAVLEHAGS